MSIIYKHQESRTDTPFLWLRFLPNNELELLTEKLPKTADLTRIDVIIKKLYPTARRAKNINRDRASE